ncbi:MAG: Gfo/Idh/MocA family oxidoreductase [Fidelibacterota bacterium]|nr:MAG: Gfo/Idh/MocA family oxidoreductase [Candidatus Neomarinimicrobiota bacterium]
MSNKKVKTAVIGVGYLGRRHVEQLLRIPEADLVGVYDIDPDTLAAVHKRYDVDTFESYDEALTAAQAVSIVVPTQQHYEVAVQALEAGCHVFIEKPIAQSLDEADQLLRLAEECERLIQVGHIERLNPAARALEKYALAPRFIEGHRLAPFSLRGTDVPVVLDLMIHDIDVVLHLVKSPVREIRANGVNVITDSIDIATARLEFENGAVANLTASRISQKQMRKLRIFQSHIYIGVDFLQQLTEVYRLVGPEEVTAEALLTMPFEFNGRRSLITYEKPTILEENALHLELGNFVRSAAGLDKPIVDGYSARAALDVAIRIQETIASNNVGESSIPSDRS